MTIGMRRCVACEDWATGEEVLCWYHVKCARGLIDPPIMLRVQALRGVAPADVLSDEQLELASLLRDLGADDWLVRQALAKEPQRLSA